MMKMVYERYISIIIYNLSKVIAALHLFYFDETLKSNGKPNISLDLDFPNFTPPC